MTRAGPVAAAAAAAATDIAAAAAAAAAKGGAAAFAAAAAANNAAAAAAAAAAAGGLHAPPGGAAAAAAAAAASSTNGLTGTGPATAALLPHTAMLQLPLQLLVAATPWVASVRVSDNFRCVFKAGASCDCIRCDHTVWQHEHPSVE